MCETLFLFNYFWSVIIIIFVLIVFLIWDKWDKICNKIFEENIFSIKIKKDETKIEAKQLSKIELIIIVIFMAPAFLVFMYLYWDQMQLNPKKWELFVSMMGGIFIGLLSRILLFTISVKEPMYELHLTGILLIISHILHYHFNTFTLSDGNYNYILIFFNSFLIVILGGLITHIKSKSTIK